MNTLLELVAERDKAFRSALADLTIKILPREPLIESEREYRDRIVKQVILSGAVVEHVKHGYWLSEVDFDENENTGWYFFPWGSDSTPDEGIGPNATEFEAYENCWFYLVERGLLTQEEE